MPDGHLSPDVTVNVRITVAFGYTKDNVIIESQVGGFLRDNPTIGLI